MTAAVSVSRADDVNGHRPATMLGTVPAWMSARSRLLDLLPGCFSEGEMGSFLGRYLMLFESIVDSLDGTITHLPDWFAPATAPEEFLPWLASWVGLVLDEGWPVERRRAVLAGAMELHRARGTIAGLTDHLERYTGIRPTIIEGGTGFMLDPKSQLGQQLMLGVDRANHFTVVLSVPDPEAIDRTRVRAVIELHRPAHTTFALFVLPDPDSSSASELPAQDGAGEGA